MIYSDSILTFLLCQDFFNQRIITFCLWYISSSTFKNIQTQFKCTQYIHMEFHQLCKTIINEQDREKKSWFMKKEALSVDSELR